MSEKVEIPITDADMKRWLYYSIRMSAKRVKGYQQSPAWSLIADLCLTGSQTAIAIARHLKIDPHQTVSEFLLTPTELR